jgi:hypothetical protein
VAGTVVRDNVVNLALSQDRAEGFYNVTMAPSKAGTYEFSFQLAGVMLATDLSAAGAVGRCWLTPVFTRDDRNRR